MAMTTLLPSTMYVCSPDAGAGPMREVGLRLVVSDDWPPVPSRSSPHRILIAPVLERAEEVTLTRTGDSYRVTPADCPARINDLVAAVRAAGGSVLFIPEMALSRASYEALQAGLRDSHRAVSRDTGRLPELAYAIVGVCEPAGNGSRNFVAVLASDGTVLAEQDKISRWDLTPDEQLWLGLGREGDALPDRLREGIEPADEIRLVELPGLGRLSVLICADMDVREPGDFLYLNGGIDWVYAPIMDRSRAPRRDGSEEFWIVRRSLRAAQATRGNVVVANSMPLTDLCNATNAARSMPFPPEAECHVALLLDGRPEQVAAASGTAALGDSTVLIQVDWFDGWSDFLTAPGR
jgi:predicted amidohydrolase